jgi:hypothetical protein
MDQYSRRAAKNAMLRGGEENFKGQKTLSLKIKGSASDVVML